MRSVPASSEPCNRGHGESWRWPPDSGGTPEASVIHQDWRTDVSSVELIAIASAFLDHAQAWRYCRRIVRTGPLEARYELPPVPSGTPRRHEVLRPVCGAARRCVPVGWDRSLVAHCHLGLGKPDRRTDKQQQTLEHLATAMTMYGEMDMTYWLEQAKQAVEE